MYAAWSKTIRWSSAAVLLLALVPAEALAQPYTAQQTGDVVRLEDRGAETVVSILPSVGDVAFEMKVKGQDILHWPYTSVAEFKARPGYSGIPFLGPWANRLDEQAFYANGKRYAFDMDLGNVQGATPIHGLVIWNDQWRVLEVKADGDSAWVTSRLEFFRDPLWMKQFPFAHAIEITHRLHAGVLQVTTKVENLSNQPMPLSIGFHPSFG